MKVTSGQLQLPFGLKMSSRLPEAGTFVLSVACLQSVKAGELPQTSKAILWYLIGSSRGSLSKVENVQPPYAARSSSQSTLAIRIVFQNWLMQFIGVSQSCWGFADPASGAVEEAWRPPTTDTSVHEDAWAKTQNQNWPGLCEMKWLYQMKCLYHMWIMPISTYTKSVADDTF